MILVMDVGNTNVKLGVYDGDRLAHTWRVSSNITRTADEYGIDIINLFKSVDVDPACVEGVIMSSVAPSLNYTLEHMCQYYFKSKKLLMVGPGLKTGLNIKYTNPSEVGADRIVNAVASYNLYGGPTIYIDFGTATTFGVVSQNGEFLGGAIAPGIKSSMESLINNTAKLPRIELSKPKNAINKTTVTNMQAGVIYGFTGLVANIIKHMKQELGLDDVTVVATGGLSELVDKEETGITHIDRTLTLKGLKMIYDMNN